MVRFPVLLTFWTDVRQLHTSRCNEVESFVDVLGFLDAHSRDLIIPAERNVT